MPTATISNSLRYFSPLRLAGPVFDKELRVASRQRRYYLLRFAYVGLLVFVMLHFWYVSVRIGGGASAVAQVSRLAQAGKGVIVTVVWFQFVAGQILAAVLLSDAISSEIRQRTLESLLVTPIGAVHIVLGKLLSRLLQLVLLLAISLPVLAVARVFGGVPWDYVVSGLCITLSGAVFAGSLSLLYSITYRHAYQAVLVVGLWYLVVWGIFVLPVMSLSAAGYLGLARVVFVMSLIDPIPALVTRTQTMLAGAGGLNTPAPLFLHCLTILFASALILALAVRRVRRVALAHKDGSPRRAKIHRMEAGDSMASPQQGGQAIRRVEGRPIVWRELCTPLLRTRRGVLFHIALWITVACCIFVVVMAFGRAMYGSLFIPILILHWLLVIRLAIAAASAVTREKEARTWPILLATPLDDGEIVKGKAFAAFRRNVPLLLPLLVLYLLAALLGPMREVRPLLFVLSVYVSLAGTIIFLLGLGLYLSTRLKTTAGAVASTLALYFVPKLLFCGVPGPLFFLAGREALGGSVGGMFVVALVPPVFFAGVGLSCMRAATRRLRRDVF